eukprot:TRINITY_DN36444_c0_g1_i1.p1 TRINITY_DN36444_c0_g1~~TRINITY_DN36444_c0_g1_i1.p1  ORF type:complete len:375 (-),score=95.57 TRINITY_DN36444_c0_g1_i1:299-1423(-)
MLRSLVGSEMCIRDRNHTLEVVAEGRRAVGDLLGCQPEEVTFGGNATTLTMVLARAVLRQSRVKEGDNIVLSQTDHDCNIGSWITVAEEHGVEIRWIRANEGCELDMGSAEQVVDDRTKLLAVGYASNTTGTVNDVKRLVDLGKQHGAWTHLDAVHYAPHGLIDVKEIGTNSLVCSSYKFFGPHVGCLYGQDQLMLDELFAYKVRPAPDTLGTPESWQISRWEPGTQNYEGIVGTTAAVNYIARIGEGDGRRERIADAWSKIQCHERAMTERFLIGISELGPDLRLFGISDPGRAGERTPTFSMRHASMDAPEFAAKLVAQGILCGYGNFYAQELCGLLELEESGGFVRCGLLHYNTMEEVDRLVDAVQHACQS